MTDERRRFTRQQRIDAWLAQDGKSAISGEPLDPHHMHADHRVPWSKGGKTTIENCDAVSPQENLLKGAKMDDRFGWQDEFIQKYMQHTEPNFFLCALPGAGKTRASIRVAKNWIAEGGIPVIVVPTLPIRRNWRDCLWAAGISIDENFYGALKEPYSGAATTYSALHNQSGVFKKLCSDYSVLLICDEIHHASENEKSTWGVDLKESFALAKRRLLLSGTPVRSDKETTSFLKIEDDPENPGKHRYKMHFLYDWPRALEDHVVRSLTFHRVEMDTVDVDFITKGKQTLSNNDESYLYYALDETKFLLSILRKANEKLDTLRRSDLTAAAMAVCKNIDHAKIVYGLLELLGQKPVMVTSEEEDSINIINDFRTDNTKKWVVSVRQISEGVDVPRLRILAYLTNASTELIFRQLVGRCVRRREGESDAEATGHIFIPERRKLTQLADKIEKLQALAFKKEGTGEPPVAGEIGTTIGGSEPIFIGYIIHGKRYDGDRVSIIRRLMEKYQITEPSASIMIDDQDFAHGLKTGEDAADITPPPPEPPWIQEDRLRVECGSKTKQLIQIRLKRLGQTRYDRNLYERLAQQVNAEFMVDKIPTGKLSISQLKSKLDRLREAIVREDGHAK